ncbi:uncharacterized protein with HEPN domain [Agrobacterium larrymoorei]|uniref:Uncharacterized protein with HEPN domain n=1 Tax=Agrobacterium larrymoorei TaxID=160699 RepID=A0AAJ2ETX6_9HYPH|nr:HepT-like ribonuclease domain-containing protein [Agrobacterium larrymoorei]MDR6102983.1 uncharacterized protein with HEPN domain [Agrobacterium larrymoorei]
MRSDSLLPYIETIETIASRAQSFVLDMDEALFLADKRTQMAVMLCLVLIGETVIKIDAEAPEFSQEHPNVPWAQMMDMRNLILLDHVHVELPAIWRAVSETIPELQESLATIRNWRAQGE